MNPVLSVVIRTKNESRYIGSVIKRLKEQKYEGTVEIILVDSGSTDNTVSIAEENGCRIILIKPEEFSFGRALNLGIEQAGGEIIINLSGHSVPVNTDYFNLMVKPFTDRTVAATFGRDIPWPEACPSQARDILNHFPESDLDENKFSNANAAIRKKYWEIIKFDEKILASEDLLWEKQIINLGYKILYIPKAKVFHSHSASLKYINKRAYIESRSVNAFAERKEDFRLSKLMKFYLGHVFKDTWFTVTKKYNLFWLFHIPLYRFSQSVGLYKGFGEGARLHNDTLSAIGQYRFEQKIPKDRKKVLLVTHCFFPESVGGTEYYTLNLAAKLIERGWSVKVVSAVRDLTQKRYKVMASKYEGLDIIKINNPSELCTRFTEYFIDHNVENIFSKILNSEMPDLVHFQHTAYLSARLPEVANQLNVPNIFTLHDYWYMCFRSQLIRPLKGPCPGPSDGVYCATCFDPVHPNHGGIPRFPILHRMLNAPFIRQFNAKKWLPPELKLKIIEFLYTRPDKKALTETFPFPCPEIWSILEHSFRMRFMKKQLSCPSFIISPSEHLKKRYEAEGFREILFIPHGFEHPQKIVNAPFNGKLVLAYLSNIIPFKGADVLLKELEFVRQRRRIKMLFYGKVLDAAYQKELELLASRFPDADISFMGPYSVKEELEKILTDVHFVVFPSLWEENHPLVIKEALLYGVPVICSSLGGAPEAVEHGVNGFIFDPYREGDLAETVNMIMDSPDLIEKVTIGARDTKIETMEEHVEKIEEIYFKTLKDIHMEAIP
ncbi:MAG: hypothetical protein A2Y97_02390 [Nitrospirae bacterium RBG_13_39_12]|nr:MAG: hypothetical protein A2Y97_02390 [Nitrospirae bacterium RBG_13_39_12]